VRYTLEYRESVRDYLRQLSLSREGRVKLYTNLIGLTAEVPDSFRSDPANRPEANQVEFSARPPKTAPSTAPSLLE
jgi:hypothetical protein